MNSKTLAKLIDTDKRYDLPFEFNTNTSNGWKLSLQGRTIEDVLYLFEHLNVKQVPVIAVVSKDKKQGKIVKKVAGHISLPKALEIMEVDIKGQAANR